MLSEEDGDKEVELEAEANAEADSDADWEDGSDAGSDVEILESGEEEALEDQDTTEVLQSAESLLVGV